MKRLLAIMLFMSSMVMFVSCSSDEEKQAEFARIVESRSIPELLNDLYVGCDGDVEALARVLNVTPSSIERLRNEETLPTDKFVKRLREVSIYYIQNNQSFTKVQSILDPEYSWYDSILNFRSHHPFWFWGINILLILLLAFVAIIAIWPILGELLIFFVAWICSLIFSPAAIEDKYVDTINPVIEQLK